MSTEIDRELARVAGQMRAAAEQFRRAARRAQVVPAGPNALRRMSTGVLLGEAARRGVEVPDRRRREMYAVECERRGLPETAQQVRRDEVRDRTTERAVGAVVVGGALSGLVAERFADEELSPEDRWEVAEMDVEDYLAQADGGEEVTREVDESFLTQAEIAEDLAYLEVDPAAVQAAQFAASFDVMDLPEALDRQAERGSGRLGGLMATLNESLGKESEAVL